ncbi:peptide ligase PGM1-related protein [Kitasatospora sp. NPDC057541]|uniref:preATP grasp domain-containing protein n=1 Tax=unclassified Kitasatospora TaxID=2633591 RepID=UPI0036C7A25F
MPRLWLHNAWTEHMVDRMDLLTRDDIDDHLFGTKRLVWLARDGDALVLPGPVPGAFLAHVARHTGIRPDRVHVVAPDADILTQGVLHSAHVLGRLRELVTPDWEFRPYIHDRGAEILAQELGLVTGSRFMAEGGAELLNSKVVFRALAAGAGFAVPDGIACRTSEDLVRTLRRLLATHKSVILKRDRAVGGHGNTVITTEPGLEGTGALRTIVLDDAADHGQVLEETGLTATHAPLGEVVLEVFHPGCTSVYVEVDCPERGEPVVLNGGRLRIDRHPPVFAGLVLPPGSVPGPAWERFTAEALRLARLVRDLGYRGPASIDAVIDQAGDVWFNEVNARMGASTHLHHIAETLVGPRWTDSHVLVSRVNVRAPALDRLLPALGERGLAWDPRRRRGIVIASDATASAGTLEYVVLAHDHEEAELLEDRLTAVLPHHDR